MSERLEFVSLANLEGCNRRELCRRFGISPETAYKWLRRAAEGEVTFKDRSRRPHHSPGRLAPEIEAQVLAVRDKHPAWGARKIAAVLSRQALEVPAASTIHAILTRHGRIVPAAGGPAAHLRFERSEPNSLWQMDFKGWSRLGNQAKLHPLTVLDDHSRFSLGIVACADETGQTVKTHLEQVFRRYGLPQAFFVDNGNPWGDSHGSKWTRFAVWLLKLGISLIHSRPHHPESRGKIERFHRSMDNEIFAMRPLADHHAAQCAFDAWRPIYNFERPHEGLGFATPSQRYTPSQRSMSDKLPEVEYLSTDIVRSISHSRCYLVFKGRNWRVPEAFAGERLAIRPQAKDGTYGVYFASHHIMTIDLNAQKSVNHVPEHPSIMSPV